MSTGPATLLGSVCVADEHRDRSRPRSEPRPRPGSLAAHGGHYSFPPLRWHGWWSSRRRVYERTLEPRGRLDCCTWFACERCRLTRDRARCVGRARESFLLARVRRRYRRRPRPRDVRFGSRLRAARVPRARRGSARCRRINRSRSRVVLQPSHPTELDSLLNDLYDPASPRYEQWLADRRVRPASSVRAPTEIDGSHLVAARRRASPTRRVQRHGGHARPATPQTVGARARRLVLRATGSPQGATGYVASAAPLVPRAVADGITSDRRPLRHAPLRHRARPRRRARSCRRRRRRPSRRAAAAAVGARRTAAPAPRRRNFAEQRASGPPTRSAASTTSTTCSRPASPARARRSRCSSSARAAPSDTRHVPLVLRAAQHGEGQAHRRRRARPTSTARSKPRSTSRRPRRKRPARRSSRTKRRTPRRASTTRTTRSSTTTAQVVSTSWGKCEALLEAEPERRRPFIDALHTLFQQAAAQGQSVFAATGDTGSEDCYDGTTNPPSETLQVDNPGRRSVRHRRRRHRARAARRRTGVERLRRLDRRLVRGERRATRAAAASRPLHAAELAAARVERDVHDVSRGARHLGQRRRRRDVLRLRSPDSTPPNSWTAVGGTSIAAPMLAGIAADIAQGCQGGRLGNFAPKLNALAAKHVYGTALTDVTTGLNWTNFTDRDARQQRPHPHPRRHVQDRDGFDLATGFGVPIASGLACPQITSMTPNHGVAGHARHAARCRPRAGDDQVRHEDREGGLVGRRRPRSWSCPRARARSTSAARTRSAPARSRRRSRIRAPTPACTARSRPTAASSTSAARATTARRTRRRCTRRSSAWPSTTRPAATGSRPPTATSTTSTRRSSVDAGAHPLNQPIVGIAATKNGDGYWLVARDGGIFAFGKARFHGSTGGIHLNQPIVGIAADAETGGYWLVASDGGIFAFDAPFYGSTGAIHLNQPIVGIAADAATGGYWLVASDGGVFAFDAPFYGSTGAIHLNQPIVGIAATDDARGYRFVASDGGVFNFGDARFSGSTGGSGLAAPVVAVTPAH